MKFSKCYICGSFNTVLIYQNDEQLSITSDLRLFNKGVKVYQCQNCGHVFKNPPQSDLKKIYQSYKLFEDTKGHDQAIFKSNSLPKSRSQIIVEALPTLASLPSEGKFLDIGCNKGLLLKAFTKFFPKWELYGFEISKDYHKYIREIKNVKKFYWGNLSKIKEKFDFISLIHTLEHVPDPLKLLRAVKNLLKSSGVILVQVPNYSVNQFDVLVFEHISHFYPQTLELIFANAKLGQLVTSQLLVPKELTFIGSPSQSLLSYTTQLITPLLKQAKLNNIFLKKYVKMVMGLHGKKPLLVFGTAEVGTWVSGLLENKFDFFIDESPWRIGKKHLGKQIKHPNKIKLNDNVILAMAPIIAKRVFEKWKHTKANFYYLSE